jgi:cell division septation protein DedD
VKAADNLGLMLFQEGEQEKAMPLIRDAAERGDPRAQYVLGLSHFNADYAPRDWVRAYALMTLAQGQGLPQAQVAITQMDSYVPLVQRQQAQSLARKLEADAKAQRSAALTAVELGSDAPTLAAASAPAATPLPAPVASQPRPAVLASPAPAPVTTVASRGPARVSTRTVASAPVAAPLTLAAAPAPKPAAAPAAAPTPRTGGSWRVQLGAFGVAANAERMWSQLAGNPALAGTRKTLLPSGKVTRLLATGYASEADASRACVRLKQQGQACLVAGQG